jgi:hypothetical protein
MTASTFRQALELGQRILVKSKFDDRWLSFQSCDLFDDLDSESMILVVLVLKGNRCIGNDTCCMTFDCASQNLEMYAANIKGWQVTKPWNVG